MKDCLDQPIFGTVISDSMKMRLSDIHTVRQKMIVKNLFSPEEIAYIQDCPPALPSEPSPSCPAPLNILVNLVINY
jgi:hypothetical protein